MPNSNPNTTPESTKPSLDKLISDAQRRSAPGAHGTIPPDDHISIPGRDDPSEGRKRTLEH